MRPCHLDLLLLISVVLLVSGCAQNTTVVLLPDPDGKVGRITVENDAGTVDLSNPAEATVVPARDNRPKTPEIMSKDTIQSSFAVVLTALPEQPQHFILYFLSGSTELAEESQQLLPAILQSIATRHSQDISIIGHSDTAGDHGYNLKLSQKRAQAVSLILTQEGVPLDHLKTTSHGEENPLIKTADNVQEPKNRRVEVVIR